VNEKAPDVGSKAMLGARPVAESTTVPPEPVGSFAETMKCRFPPTLAFCGPGTVMIGRTSEATTVLTTSTWFDKTPSVTVKLRVYVPGASAVVGVQVNVPEIGEDPWMVVKLASEGSWLAERVSVEVGMDESVAVTVKETVDVWATVSVDGALRTGAI
jgi:hypothetical protein